jgi:hypothetical protein
MNYHSLASSTWAFIVQMVSNDLGIEPHNHMLALISHFDFNLVPHQIGLDVRLALLGFK